VEIERFCSGSRVVVVAGKGGVGKTTVAATLALTAARAGLSVLVVDVQGGSGIEALFDAPPLGYEPSELAPGITARTLTPDQALLDYLHDHGMRAIAGRLVASGALDAVAQAVPGMKDILVLGKVKQLERAGVADLVVVDAPAAGHAISFLRSPLGLREGIRVGPIRKQADDVAALLADPARCRVLLVTLAEETPVAELTETAFALEDAIGVALAPVVVNALVPPAAHADGAAERAALAAAGVAEHEAGAVLAVAGRLRGRHQRQQAQVARLAATLPLHQLPLPVRPHAALGPDDLAVLADALAEAVERLPVPT
jgi:anion-transporting  ArsA/GET3 family ATPase